MPEDIKPIIRALLETVTGKPLPSDVSLLGSGVIDSLMTMRLVTEVERRFDIMLDVEDFTQFNFDSVDAIAALVASKQA